MQTTTHSYDDNSILASRQLIRRRSSTCCYEGYTQDRIRPTCEATVHTSLVGAPVKPRHLTRTSRLNSVAAAPASDDNSIHVYSPVTGQLIRSLEGHQGGVWALAAMKDTRGIGATVHTYLVGTQPVTEELCHLTRTSC